MSTKVTTITTAKVPAVTKTEHKKKQAEPPIHPEGTGVHHTTKVNPDELKRLLETEPPLERVVVRCDRTTGVWEVVNIANREYVKIHGGTVETRRVLSLILVNVTFESEKSDEIKTGCGASGYIGFAVGSMVATTRPASMPVHGVRHLYFNPFNGEFHEQYSGNKLTKADYLILKENCASEYITKPEAKP